MSDLISREAVLREIWDTYDTNDMYFSNDDINAFNIAANVVKNAPTVDAVEVVRCKDCKRHNGAFGDFLINEQRYLREDEVCPLVYWRGKAKGNEFNYQYCIYGERRTNETD